ncbi:Uncharacterised protein [Mycobacterium tuberculosis]|uniref:Uncharacterized protein n=1 Tax=Mycobacterium tuberculosis TaxID=1773 RepID=A0A916L835_MYCTX|nr:Uncharacterised protein [Mycobacterium tuberculosis]COX52889.1 Uncharacterised protein [Mycobacterium tuberculosis]
MTVPNATLLGDRCNPTRYGAGTLASPTPEMSTFQPGSRSTNVTDTRSGACAAPR